MLLEQTPPPSTWVLTGRGSLVRVPLTCFLSSGLGPCVRGLHLGDGQGMGMGQCSGPWWSAGRTSGGSPKNTARGQGLAPSLPTSLTQAESPTPGHHPRAPGHRPGGCVVFKPQKVEETCFSVTRTRL